MPSCSSRRRCSSICGKSKVTSRRRWYNCAIWGLDTSKQRLLSTHIRFPLSSILRSPLLLFCCLVLRVVAEGLDERFNISPGLLENHGTNGPTVRVSGSIREKEVIRENASRRCVPWITWSPCKMESKSVSCAALLASLIPVRNVMVGDSIFEPIVGVD